MVLSGSGGRVDANVFQLGEGFDPVTRTFAAKTRLFPSAEGDRAAGDLDAVDRHHPEIERPCKAQRTRPVAGDDVGHEAVVGGVGTGDAFGLAVERKKRGDGSEGFLAVDQRIVGGADEKGRQ